MNRRQALKAALATSINGRLVMKAFAVESSAKFIVFYDPKRFPRDFCDRFLSDHPGSTAYPVEGNLDDAVRLFQS